MTSKVSSPDSLARLAQVIDSRLPQNGGNPQASYVARLLHQGPNAFLKKIGEEATEVLLAAKSGDSVQLVYETADLWFHCMVLLAHHGLSADDVLRELARREGVSGIAEKANRKKS